MRVRGLLLFCLFCFSTSGRDGSDQALTLNDLRSEITAHLTQEKFNEAIWGIKVISLESGVTLYETNALKLLKPASNAKVFTAALALDKFDPGFRIRTSILAAEKPGTDGVLKGDLIVYGRGDPSIAARFQNGSYTNLLDRLVQGIRDAGIKRIEGDLVGDDTYFKGPRAGSGWTWDDLQFYYGAEVSALSFQDNVVDLFLQPGPRVGARCELRLKPQTDYLEFVNRTRTTETNVPASITVHRPLGERRVYLEGSLPRNHGTLVEAVTVPDPALWFATMLREELAKQGIAVAGKVRSRSWPEVPTAPAAFKEIASIDSAPVSEIVAKMLKPSQNLYAQLLLLQAGAQSRNNDNTSEARGLHELRAFLKRAGVSVEEVLLEEGSGLSRASLVTPNSLAAVLKFMAAHSRAELFRQALPAPGEGTLRNRFSDWKDAPGPGRTLRAKTGTIRYVNTLSGYLQTQAGEPLAFAIMLNAYDNNSLTPSRDEVEAVVRLLARLKEKAAPKGR
jgi:D-alanyl-D-alanine carboxypeptidase/D-alanyl-D-alanine-endopeptidase (penicillin-binding protein 4)